VFRRTIIPLFLILISAQYACAGLSPHHGHGYEIQLEDTYGNRLQSYMKDGSTYVLGYHKNRYNIRVFNRSHRRVEAVVTVDGRDTITGEIGDFVKQRGYVIDARDSVLIEGFRRSMAKVAAFRFTHPANSYSARRGTPQHVGVIGVAIFKEKGRRQPLKKVKPRLPRYPSSSHDDAHGLSPTPERSSDLLSGSLSAKPFRGVGSKRSKSSSSVHHGGAKMRRTPERSPHKNQLGTQYGENQNSRAVQVTFRRVSPRKPARMLAIYYDSRAGLAARGIHLQSGEYAEPNPFPKRHFAPPPR
jgi:hypothetical protein